MSQIFTRIRNRLTLLYTGIFAVFLFGFVGILYFTFSREILGYLYLGRDVTAYYRVLNMLFPLIMGFSLLFIIFAGWLGYWMAGKTMIPIQHSVSRQMDFTANASHELRTPLSVFLVSLDLVLKDSQNQLSSTSNQVLHDLRDEAKKMADMVNHLLTLARADLDVVDLNFINFDLRPVAGQVIRSMSVLAEEKEVKLNFASPQPLMVFGDLEHLRRLLYLLLDNALKYTPRGGRISLIMEKQTYGLNREIAIIIQDNGIGIPKEAQEQIFDRFFRVDLNHSRQIEGSGLGLSIAQWIVQAHDGSIKVESNPGQGTTIKVKIPVVENVVRR